MSLIGIGGGVAVAALNHDELQLSLVVAVLCVITVIAECVPIRIPRRDYAELITTATTFSFALLIIAGLPVALLTTMFACVVGELRQHKPAQRLLFNVGQYGLSVLVSGAVLAVTTGIPRPGPSSFEPIDLPGMLAAAIAFFVCNNAFVGIASALSRGVTVRDHLRQESPFQASIANLMLGISPIVVLICDFSLLLLPSLLLPMVAVHRAGIAAVRDHHRALHDDLTGLPNRTQFNARAGAALQQAKLDAVPVAFMILDLNRFKEINDTLGHHQGDELLKLVSTRLAGVMQETETAARFGGDEFAVVCALPTGPAEALEVADRLLAAFDAPFQLDDLQLTVDVSIGVALWPEHGEDTESLLRCADVGLYQAKESQLDVVLYDPLNDSAGVDRLALLTELRHGIDQGQLRLAYMPKVALDTGAVLGMEALVRWEHPERGLLPPGVFIPYAEGTGLIGALTLEVLDQALTQASKWIEAGTPVRVAVNLSARNLLDRGLPTAVGSRLESFGVPADLLELEITESTIMADPARALIVLEELAAMGIHLTIDDFGTGYSSLAYLKRLPVTTLKIDRSFVTSMLDDGQDAMIVQSTIDLGRNLGLNVVAEGIEDEATRRELADLGCHAGQGYLYGPPAAPDMLKTPPAGLPTLSG